MPDDILISELSNAPQIDDSAVFPLTQDNGGSPATFKATMSEMASKIFEGTTFANLVTTAKTPIGAINEIAGGGGGSTELIGTASGSIATFSDGGNNIPMKSCEVAIVAQQASGTPSPSNPLPITGFSSVNVAVTPKNLFNPQCLIDNGATESGGVYSFANQVITNVLLLPLNTSERLTFKYKGRTTTANTNGYMAIIYTDGTMTRDVTSHTADTWYDVTLTSESGKTIRGIGLSYYSSRAKTDFTEIQLEIGTTATAYEPFGTTTPVSLGQTIYGGTAELVGGNGIKTYDRVDLSTLNWIYVPSINVFYADNDLGEYRGVGKIGLCEIYDVVDNVPRALDVPVTNNIICGYSDTDIHRLYCRNTAYTDATQFKNSMVGKYLVYKLATPTTFTFTGANIPTLSGVNNVYADSGDVDLEYFNENADEIAELIRLMTRT